MVSGAMFGWLATMTHWKWLLAGLALLGAEIVTGTGWLLWAGLAALLTGVVALGFILDWRVQVAVFGAFFFLLAIAGRRVLRPSRG